LSVGLHGIGRKQSSAELASRRSWRLQLLVTGADAGLSQVEPLRNRARRRLHPCSNRFGGHSLSSRSPWRAFEFPDCGVIAVVHPVRCSRPSVQGLSRLRSFHLDIEADDRCEVSGRISSSARRTRRIACHFQNALCWPSGSPPSASGPPRGRSPNRLGRTRP